MLKTAGEAGEAGDVKTGWVRLSTSAPLRLITAGEAGERRYRATTLDARRFQQLQYVWAYMPVFCRHCEKYLKWYRIALKCISTEKKHIKHHLVCSKLNYILTVYTLQP